MFQRKDGIWQEQITITINGKKKSKYFYGKDRKTVKQKLLAYQGEKEEGRYFSEIADEWWEQHSKNLAYNSLKNYKPAYCRAKDEFGDYRIKTIKPNDINVYIMRFSQKYTAQKTVKTQLMVINLICKYAVLSGDLEYNPVSSVGIPKNLQRTQRNLPSDEDIARVKKSLNCTFGLFAYFLLYTGCRRGEALAIQFKDIERVSKVIHIRKSIYHDNNQPHVKSPKTVSGLRDIVLMDCLLDKLPIGAPDEFLFSNDEGNIMTETQFQRKWELYQKESGVSCTPHQLRHAYATILFEAGITAKDAQELLGHSTISTTQDIYTHIRKSRMDTVRETLNSMT